MLKTTFLSALIASIFAVASAEGAIVSVSPTSQSVVAGSTFSVNVNISGLALGIAPSLGVFDFDFGFDPSKLAFQSAAFGTGLDVLGLGSLQFATPGPGTVNLFELSLDSIAELNDFQDGSFILATITFLATSLGDAPFSLSANAFGDAEGNALDVTLGNGGVTVVAVPGGEIPEPATFVLAALGLLAAGLMLGRRPG